jgi:hypothetical protein
MILVYSDDDALPVKTVHLDDSFMVPSLRLKHMHMVESVLSFVGADMIHLQPIVVALTPCFASLFDKL